MQDIEIAGTTLLFEHDKEVLARSEGSQRGRCCCRTRKTVTPLVSNFGCEPVQLEDGETLGQLESATVVDANLETMWVRVKMMWVKVVMWQLSR